MLSAFTRSDEQWIAEDLSTFECESLASWFRHPICPNHSNGWVHWPKARVPPSSSETSWSMVRTPYIEVPLQQRSRPHGIVSLRYLYHNMRSSHNELSFHRFQPNRASCHPSYFLVYQNLISIEHLLFIESDCEPMSICSSSVVVERYADTIWDFFQEHSTAIPARLYWIAFCPANMKSVGTAHNLNSWKRLEAPVNNTQLWSLPQWTLLPQIHVQQNRVGQIAS